MVSQLQKNSKTYHHPGSAANIYVKHFLLRAYNLAQRTPNPRGTIPIRHITCRNTHGPGIPGPCMSVVKPLLPTQSDFIVAISTIDRPAIGRLKRYFGLFTALGAYGRKHLAWESVAVATTSVPL